MCKLRKLLRVQESLGQGNLGSKKERGGGSGSDGEGSVPRVFLRAGVLVRSGFVE
jgi:hypothetical protein